MRLNKYLAQATGMSRRAADAAIAAGRIQVNNRPAQTGQQVQPTDHVTLDGSRVTPKDELVTIMLNKPVGYVCSRRSQGNPTIYELLPEKYHNLKPVGRLDKDSSGLLLLTNDGELAHKLTHPSFKKTKSYEVELARPLNSAEKIKIRQGIILDDGVSRLDVRQLRAAVKKNPIVNSATSTVYSVAMSEGRNRQIRRTFETLGYRVIRLHRIRFGQYKLEDLRSGNFTHVAKTTPDDRPAA